MTVIEAFTYVYRVRTDLEKSLKMTLVLENSLNSKKMQFVLKLSLNFEKISLIIRKSPWKWLKTDFLDAVRNKNQENCKIGNRKRSAMPYSAVVPPWYSILFYLVQVIRIECNRKWNLTKRKSGKAKTKVVCIDNTQSWNRAETMSSKGKCVYDLE